MSVPLHPKSRLLWIQEGAPIPGRLVRVLREELRPSSGTAPAAYETSYLRWLLVEVEDE